MNDAAYRRIGIQVIIHTAPVLARADVAAGGRGEAQSEYLTIVPLLILIYSTP